MSEVVRVTAAAVECPFTPTSVLYHLPQNLPSNATKHSSLFPYCGIQTHTDSSSAG